MDLPLSNHVALVTGSARRLGRSIALHLAGEGADVAVHYHGSAKEAADVVAEIEALGRKCLAIKADLANTVEIHHMVEQVAQHFGRLDILVNSAANFLPASVNDTTEAIWDAVLNVNLKAPFFCAQGATPLLKQSRGTIINISDVAGVLGWTGYIPHSIAKAGVIMLTRCLAKALAPDVRVNAIVPGTITMPGDAPEIEADFIRRAPLHRTGTTGDIAEAVSFLIGSPFITGQMIIVDGGRTLTS
jgi:NAD(P)-dependent dehydrogenase (short-subunit alcohol dehydrogenase family)